MDDHPPSGAGTRRTFSPQFKRDFLLVYDYFMEISPDHGASLLQKAKIPPRYMPRWRKEGHLRPNRADHHSNAVHYPMAGVYRGRHRARRRNAHPDEHALSNALLTVILHLLAK
ncbi:hypothetical protein AB0C21_14560 [Spirillospora sp. NPDC049024]